MADSHLLAAAAAPPPLNTLLSGNGCDFRKISHLKWKVKEALVGLGTDLKSLREEQVLLNQLLYKIHNRFHNDKGYRDLRMVDKTLKKLVSQNLLRGVEGLLPLLPTLPSPLPTQPMAHHSVLQVYALAALTHRLVVLATNSSLLATQRLNLGHFWGVGASQLACLARIWLLARRLGGGLHEVYHPMLDLLPLLPGPRGEQELPPDLSTLLPDNVVARRQGIKEVDVVKVDPGSLASFLDLGVEVRRPKLESEHLVNKVEEVKIDESLKQVVKKDAFSEIHSLEELKQFLETETKTRKVSKKTSLSRKLSQDKWKLVRAEVLNAVNEKTPNKSLKTCRKLLRAALIDPS